MRSYRHGEINSQPDDIRMFNYLYQRYVESLEWCCVGQKNMKCDCIRGQVPEIDQEETYDRVKNLYSNILSNITYL